MNIASNGQINFASGQTFPGVGTVTSVGSGAGLAGGPITTSGTLSIATGAVAVVNGVIYVGSGDALSGPNGVYALNARIGARLWSYTTSGPVFSSPAVVNGVVYVGCDDGNTYAFSLKKGGHIKGSFQASRAEDASP